MNNIIYTDIQTLLDNNININDILIQVENIMKIEYPDFIDWFKNIFIPGIYLKERNITLLLKKKKIIGFANLKTTKKEKKIYNLYIKKSFLYTKQIDLLINKSINLLKTEDTSFMISSKELQKCSTYLFDNNLCITNCINNEKNNCYYIINGNYDFKFAEKLVKQKCKKYIYNKKNN